MLIKNYLFTTTAGRIKYLLDTLQLTQQEFADAIGLKQSAISQMVNGKAGITMDNIKKLHDMYHVDCNWMVSGKGNPFSDEDKIRRTLNDQEKLQVITVDNSAKPNIVMVPVRAQAGYALQRVEPTYMQELPSFRLPIPALQQGQYRAFEVDGDSMEPTLFKDDVIICRAVEDVRWVRNQGLYVIVMQGDVVVKRVKNKIKEFECLELISDNTFYPPYDVNVADIVEVWAVYARLTLHIPPPGTLN